MVAESGTGYGFFDGHDPGVENGPINRSLAQGDTCEERRSFQGQCADGVEEETRGKEEGREQTTQTQSPG